MADNGSGFWGRLRQEGTDRLQQRTSRMEEVAREMARRQAEAEQRRREEEERRRQQEAERQQREAEQRADEQRRQQEEENRMRLLEAQKQNERAQRERGALVLAGLNNRDHENYQRAIDNDQMLTQETWERDWAIRNGDTQAAERSNAWINDRKNMIRQNTIPQTRSLKTLAEYQDEWNADKNRKSAVELAIEQRKAQEKEKSQLGLSQYTAAQAAQKKAQEDKDTAAKEQTELKMSGEEQEVYTRAVSIAKRFGYTDDKIPGTLEELAELDPAIGQDDVVRNYLTYKGHIQDKADDAEQRIQNSDQEMRTLLHGDQVTAEDWDDLQRYNKNKWGGQVFNPMGYSKENLDTEMKQIAAGINTKGFYNDPQTSLARQTLREIKRRYDIISDPKAAIKDLDNEIAWLEGLTGSHWEDKEGEIAERLKNAKAQRTLMMAAAMKQGSDFKLRSESGYKMWHDADGRTMGDIMNIGLNEGSNEEDTRVMDVSLDIGNDRAAQQVNKLSDEGQALLYMTQDERAAYFALYRDSPEKAREFMDAMSGEISERRAEKRDEEFRKEAEKLPGVTDFATFGMELAKPFTGIVTAVDSLVLGNEYRPDTDAAAPDAYQRAVRETRKAGLTKWAEKNGWSPALIAGLNGAYEIVMSVGDNLARTLGNMAMGIQNPDVSTLGMSLGAAGSFSRDLMEDGVDPRRAMIAGGVAGLGEYITEQYWNSKMFSIIKGTDTDGVLVSLAKSFMTEGTSEEASNLIQLAGEALALGDDNSFRKKIDEYYYYTGSMEEAQKLATQDLISEGLYTIIISGLSGVGMDLTARGSNAIWKKHTENQKKRLQGTDKSETPDAARDSYGTQDGAEAAAEGAMPQYSSEELDEALMAAAAPMTAQEQQTDALLDGQQTADAVTAEADAQRAAEAAQIRRNDNVARIAREMAAGENARLAGVEDMPVERRAEGPAGDYRQNDRMPAGVQAQQAADRAEVEPMPVARREEMPAAEPGTVEAKVQAVPLVREQTVKRLAQEKVRKLADEWISEDDSAEDVMKNATLADVKANAHDDSADGIHDDAAWRETAGSVYDDLMDQYGADLADDTDGIWGKLAGYLTGQVKDVSEVFAKTNNPLFSTMQRGELYVMAGNIAEEYTRRMEAMKLKAREMGKKYGFVTGEDVKEYGGNGVVLRTVGDDMSAEQVTQLRILDRFAKNLRADGLPGLTINVYKDIRSTDGGKLNGSYNTDGIVQDAATVNLSLDAEGGAILRAAGHELYHMVETWGKTQADKIRGYVLDALQATEGYDLDARRAELKEAYGEDADIDSEIVADSMFDVLNNEETVTQVMKENKGLGQRIAEFVKKIGTALKGAVERIAGMGSREAQALKDQADVLDRIRDMWTKGVEIAQRNIQAARAAENVEGYSIKAVADATDSEGRTAALDTVAGELVKNTQNAMITADTDAAALTRRLSEALAEYGKGGKSLAAALNDHGLQNITDENDRKAAAWLGRELADPVAADKQSKQTLEEQFHEIWDEDESDINTIFTGGPNTTAERALDLLYKIHDQRDRKGLWKENLDNFVEEIAEDSDVDRDKIKNMLTLLYSSIDNENRVYSQNAADYAGLIVDEIVNAHRGAERAVSEDETAVYKGLRGTVIQLSDALAPTSKQTKKDGTSLKYTKYDYGDIGQYGSTVRQLNNFGRAAGIKFQIRSNEKNRGVAPSTLLAENPTLAAWVGFGDIDDNGNEADLLNRILGWVDSYEKRSQLPADPDRLNKLGYGKVEKIILNYFDMPGRMDDTQRAVEAIKKQAAAEQKDLEDEIYGLRWMIEYKDEQLQGVREDRAALEEDLDRQERATEAARRRIERMKQRAETVQERERTERTLKRMRQWVLHPTKEDGKHVVEEMRPLIAAALRAVDTSSRNKPDSVRSIDYAGMINALDDIARGENGEAIALDPDLIPTLKELKESAGDKVLLEMNADELKRLNRSLNTIMYMARTANSLHTQASRAHVDAISDSMIQTLSEKADLKAHRKGTQTALNFINWTMMDSERYFDNLERMAGPGGKVLHDILRHGGLDQQIKLTEDLKEQFKVFDQWNYKNWAAGRNQKATTFDVMGGKQITLTDAQIMSLYLLMQREQARIHILKGGIQATPIDVKGKVVRQATPVHVSEDDVNKIIGTLSDEQIACADALQKIVGGWGSKIGNDTSLIMYGYRKFGEDHYFPIKVVPDNLGVKGTEFEENQKAANLYAIINKGFTKELKPKASNPLMLGNAFDVGLDHLAGMIAYRSWGPALMDATRVLNHKMTDENGAVADSLIHQMNRTMGKEASNWLLQLMKDINGLAKDPIESEAAGFTRMFRNFKAAAVGFNISTILKQGLSIVRAFDVIPSYYFPTGRQLTERFKTEGEKGDRTRTVDNLMNKYAPIYAWKQDGRFTMDTGKDIRSIMLPKTETFANKFTEFGMKGAGAADNMTWHTIWFAAENMIAKTRTDLKVGSDAFYKAVGEKFTECVDKTQVVDSIMHRAKVMRSNSMWVKLGTSFMGEPLKTFNQAADAIRAFAEDKSVANGKKLAKTSMVLLSSAVLQAAIASIISGFRHWNDDEPLEETIRKYLLGEYDKENGFMNNAVEFLFGNNLAGEINPINYIPFVRDFADVAQGHDIVRDDMQMLTNLWNKMSALTNDSGKASTAKKIVELGSAIADLFGVPASNIFKEIDYVSNWGSRALEQAGMNAEGIQYLRLMYNRAMSKSTNQTEYAKYMLKLEEAEKAGRVEHEFVERVRKDLGGAYDPEKFEKKVAALQLEGLTGDTDLEGSLAKYEALIKAMDSGDRQKEKEIRAALARNGTKEDTITKNVRTVRMLPYTEGDTIDEYYDEYVKRMKAGDKAAAQIGRILADGYKDKPENHTSEIKEALARDPDFYQAEVARYNGDQDAHVNIINKYDKLGFDHDTLIAAANLAYNRAKQEAQTESGQAKTTTTPKTYGDSYGFTGTDLGNAFVDNSDSFWDVLEDLRKQGKTDESIKSSITSAAKPLYLELKESNPSAADDLRHRLLALGLGYTERQIRGWK